MFHRAAREKLFPFSMIHALSSKSKHYSNSNCDVRKLLKESSYQETSRHVP